jgi:hypothetical protein
MRDLDPPLERALRIGRGVRHVLVSRMHPEFAAGCPHDVGREPVVVRMRMGADEELHVGETPAGLVQSPLELLACTGLVYACVHEQDAFAGLNRERVDVRDARPGKREPETPEAWHYPVGPPALPSAADLAHTGRSWRMIPASLRFPTGSEGYGRRTPAC